MLELLKQIHLSADKPYMKNHRQTLFKGFSLIELMIIIAIVGIMAALSAPSYLQYLANSGGASLASQLLAAIRLAKNEAQHRGTKVAICALTSNSATPTASAMGTCATSGSSWAYGWQVYVVSTDTLLYFAQPTNATAISTSASSITFYPSGIPNPNNTTFTIKPSGCSYGYQVTVSATGTSGSTGLQIQGGPAGTITCP